MLDWDAIKLENYIQIYNILMDKELDETDKICLIIQELYNKNVYNMPVSEAKPLIEEVSKLLATNIPNNKYIPDTISLAKTEYIITKDLSKITTAQYMDYMSYIQEDTDKNVNTFDKFLSIFIIPVGHSYNDGYNIKIVRADIRCCMSIVDCLSITAFFFHYYQRLLKIFRRYLIWQTLKMRGITWKEKKIQIKTLISGDYFPL